MESGAEAAFERAALSFIKRLENLLSPNKNRGMCGQGNRI